MVAPKSIDKMTLPQLYVHLQAIEELIERKKREAKQELVARLREEAQDAGFDINELFGVVKGKGGKAKAPAKYRDPESGLTWSGRGRKPNWLVAYEVDGRDVEEFTI